MSQPIRVLLADDHAVVRKGIREFLEDDPEIVVVAEAANGQEALRLIAEHSPQVAVLDVQMPVLNGIDATRAIRALPQASVLPIVAVTANAFDDDREATPTDQIPIDASPGDEMRGRPAPIPENTRIQTAVNKGSGTQ